MQEATLHRKNTFSVTSATFICALYHSEIVSRKLIENEKHSQCCTVKPYIQITQNIYIYTHKCAETNTLIQINKHVHTYTYIRIV